jgi:exopolyphosphatase/guanosine-5'-triphosphate,3'-diphosphate pyrophosphatase
MHGEIIGAIDAGTNALRAAAARVLPDGGFELLERWRLPVRLGRGVFVDGCMGAPTIAAAVGAFCQFRDFFVTHGVGRYRAIGTSAVREAVNRAELVGAIRKASGLELEAISGAEEIMLLRGAVQRAFPPSVSPGLIADLGGGSLEMCVVEDGAVRRTMVLPLGTVRTIETRGLDGAITGKMARALGREAIYMLDDAFGAPPALGDAPAALCGGNARALARICPGPTEHGLPTMDLDALSDIIDEMLFLDVEGRMEAYGVRRDRAEVMAVAAVVFVTLGDWLNVDSFVVPEVGVLDGVLEVLARGTMRSGVLGHGSLRTGATDRARWDGRRL